MLLVGGAVCRAGRLCLHGAAVGAIEAKTNGVSS
jgi:hypothetical protein